MNKKSIDKIIRYINLFVRIVKIKYRNKKIQYYLNINENMGNNIIPHVLSI